MMEDDAVLEFVRERAPNARFVTSVCTGALVLGAAGLLKGYRATTHWLSLDLLPLFGAEPVEERVVVDRNRITGGGVTAGIDFGLAVAARVHGAGNRAGDPADAAIQSRPRRSAAGRRIPRPDGIVRKVLAARGDAQSRRRAIAERAAARMAARRAV